MSPNIINELLSIEAFAEELRQKCYRARKKLEGFYPPASFKKRSGALSDGDKNALIANRKKNLLKKVK